MKKEIIENYVKSKLHLEPTGHDYYHLNRVRNNALYIASYYDVDLELVEVAALVHDVIDHKLNINLIEETEELKKTLIQAELSTDFIDQVFEIIDNISFSKGNIPSTLEGKIVQDADRLDAIGAIGIARAFAYGGNKQRPIYDPTTESKNHTIQHFYDKLLSLKDLMNTDIGIDLAENRTKFMEFFLQEFYNEWE